MITYIRGILEGMEEDKVIVDVGGVGYGILHGRNRNGQASGSWKRSKDPPPICMLMERSDAVVWLPYQG